MMKFFALLLIFTTLFSFTSCLATENGDYTLIHRLPESDSYSSTNKNTDKNIDKNTDNFTDKSTDKSTNEATEPHVHSWNAVITEPTVDSVGYTTYSCVCGESYEDDITPKKVELPFVLSGLTNIKIVLPENANRYVLYASDRLSLSIKNLTGIDSLESAESDFEVLIGDTYRAESIALKATLAKDEYAIKLIDKKLIIVAENEVFLYEAVKYFVDTYFTTSYARIGDGELILLTDDINIKQEGDKASLHYILSTSNKLSATVKSLHTLNNEKYGAADADPRIYRRQGGCYNGENYYQVFITKNEELAVIAKKNVITGEIIYSEPRLMDHANDATYNPYTDRLYVGNSKTVWVYDGTTLQFIESFTLAYSTSRISYSPDRHKFVVASYRIYDESFNYTGTYLKSQFSTLYGDLTLSSQGTACDDTFIYSLLIESLGDGRYNAYIGVLDWYGNTIAFITVEFPDKIEPENISIVDGKIYVAACSAQPVATLYEITFE